MTGPIKLVRTGRRRINFKGRSLHNDAKDPLKVRRNILYKARYRAKLKGLACNLDLDDVIIPNFCPVLDIPLFFGAGKPSDYSPTLDRLVPELGYVKGNIVVISMLANSIKNKGRVDQIRRVADWLEMTLHNNFLK